MKLIIYFGAIFLVFLFSYKETEASAQGILPFYGGGPLSYSDNRDDDDIGLLLSVLLLATRNRGNGGGCGCCGCCSGNNIPIPYPIPIPTNNPIIVRPRNYDEGYSAASTEPREDIFISSDNTSNADADSNVTDKTTNNNNNDAASAAAS